MFMLSAFLRGVDKLMVCKVSHVLRDRSRQDNWYIDGLELLIEIATLCGHIETAEHGVMEPHRAVLVAYVVIHIVTYLLTYSPTYQKSVKCS